MGSVCQSAGKHHPRESLSTGLLDHQIPKCKKHVCVILQAPNKAVATTSWLHSLSGAFYPALEAQDVSTPVAIKNPLILCWVRTQHASSLIECYGDTRWWLCNEKMLTGVPLQPPPPPPRPPLSFFSQTGWGAHLQELTAAGEWSPHVRKSLVCYTR